MGVLHGSTSIIALAHGSTPIVRAYHGADLFYGAAFEPPTVPAVAPRRYWRLVTLTAQAPNGTWMGMVGVEMRHEGVNLIGSGTAFSSSNAGSQYVAANGFVPWTGSGSVPRWSAASHDGYVACVEWLAYDFGEPVTIDEVTITGVQEPEQMPLDLAVESSDNGYEWFREDLFTNEAPWTVDGTDTRTYTLSRNDTQRASFLQYLSLTNADAETGDATGWDHVGATAGIVLTSAIPEGPRPDGGGGTYLFSGGNGPWVQHTQTVDLPEAHHASADAGELVARLTAWAIGTAGDRDSARLLMMFYDASDVLLTRQAHYAHDPASYEHLAFDCVVPSGTRKIAFGWNGLRDAGTECSCYVDDFKASLWTAKKAYPLLYAFSGSEADGWVTDIGPVPYTGAYAFDWLAKSETGATLQGHRDIDLTDYLTAVAAGTFRVRARFNLASFDNSGDNPRVWAMWVDDTDTELSLAFESASTVRRFPYGYSTLERSSDAAPTTATTLRLYWHTELSGGSVNQGLLTNMAIFADA